MTRQEIMECMEIVILEQIALEDDVLDRMELELELTNLQDELDAVQMED